MSRVKNILIIAVFIIIIFGLGVSSLLLPDADVSYAERRKLKQTPELTAEAVFSGEYMSELEDYLLDQFPLRDGFRTVKAASRFYAFRQADNNGIWIKDGGVFKIDSKLNEKQIAYAAGRMSYVAEKYLSGMNVYYSIIPDKNYFAAEENGYPALDYGRLKELFQSGATGMEYIDVFGCLGIDDYYRTDPHWRQESLDDVVSRLTGAMGIAAPPANAYEKHELEPFYGAFMGQSALPVKPDTLTYLTSAATESASVTSAEYEGARPVYTLDKFEGMDGYDVFLSGAQAVLTIASPEAETDRELVIFRDSFGGSLAPLLLGSYSKITLVDLRYISADYLADYVDFSDGADALFLYSTTLINSGMLLK